MLERLFLKKTQKSKPVCDVDIKRYLGTWYEIARYSHPFEKGLEQVTATYSLKKNGRIQVVNRGYKNDLVKEARAVAWIQDKVCTGRLWVQFFPFIKAEYKIIYLDHKQYSYAVVTSSKSDYLWILSRAPHIEKTTYEKIINFIISEGFNIEKLQQVNH